MDVLTVEEMLLYTAQLKRPLREDTASKRAAVDALIRDLGLDGCRNTRIGNAMHRGISGGQVRINKPYYLDYSGEKWGVCIVSHADNEFKRNGQAGMGGHTDVHGWDRRPFKGHFYVEHTWVFVSCACQLHTPICMEGVLGKFAPNLE